MPDTNIRIQADLSGASSPNVKFYSLDTSGTSLATVNLTAITSYLWGGVLSAALSGVYYVEFFDGSAALGYAYIYVEDTTAIFTAVDSVSDAYLIQMSEDHGGTRKLREASFDRLFSRTLETGLNVGQWMRGVWSCLLGKITGVDPTENSNTIQLYAKDGVTVRMTVTTDNVGNRSLIVHDDLGS